MIRIDKGDAPATLVSSGGRILTRYKVLYDNDQAAYVNGKPFVFGHQYASQPVKNRLKARQYDKCCFSEAKFNGDYPDVEHFRPKGRTDLLGTKNSLYPGYYWLAYEWSNLFYCKAIINCTYKRNFFPLADETQRNRSHHDTHIESPMIIDPSLEDPRIHIGFHEDEIKPLTEKGRFNIEFLGLRDPTFVAGRNRLFKLLKLVKTTAEGMIKIGYPLNHPAVADLLAELKAAMQPDAEFSSMAIDLLQGWPHIQ